MDGQTIPTEEQIKKYIRSANLNRAKYYQLTGWDVLKEQEAVKFYNMKNKPMGFVSFGTLLKEDGQI